jgi:hypothetical protein
VSRYKQTVEFLDGLRITLGHLKTYIDANPTDTHASSISDQIENIRAPFDVFQEAVTKYEESLGGASTSTQVGKVPREVRWALKELSGDFEKLKFAILQLLQVTDSLLLLQQL